MLGHESVLHPIVLSGCNYLYVLNAMPIYLSPSVIGLWWFIAHISAIFTSNDRLTFNAEDIITVRSVLGNHKQPMLTEQPMDKPALSSIRESWCSTILHEVTPIIPAWRGNSTHYKMWDEITYPFPNFNGAIIEVWEWVINSIPLYCACDYLSMLGLKLINVRNLQQLLRSFGCCHNRHHSKTVHASFWKHL